ncbi:MAG TPA: TetR/AcrR family transcriptional regulator [Gammaproteobacteria bacterium]|jgi:AcrR family transcriptional regulator|nr:TetR/AcrR family transcriptional regulator [Gammaproteobacteria bacterium]
MPYSKDHKARSKQKILDSARELFLRNGFERVSISQIMTVARMTHGAFYAHFESKEALFSASFLDTLRDNTRPRLAKAPFTLKHLMSLITDYLNLRELAQTPKPGPESVLVNEIGSTNPQIRTLYETSYFSMKKMIEKRITALSRLNRLPIDAQDRDTVSEKARAVLTTLVGAVAIAKSLPHEEEQRNLLATAQRQILAILGANEREFEGFSL